VGQLLDETLPPVDPALNILFSKQLPVSELPGYFSYWTVPTSCNARGLLDQFGQAWFDGSVSVMHTSHDIVNESLALLEKNQPSLVRLDTTVGTLRDRAIQWVIDGYHAVNRPEIVKQV
jgi:hypothetical protein